jgi:hypothetical protein
MVIFCRLPIYWQAVKRKFWGKSRDDTIKSEIFREIPSASSGPTSSLRIDRGHTALNCAQRILPGR